MKFTAFCANAAIFVAGASIAEEPAPSSSDSEEFEMVAVTSKNCSERIPASGPGSGTEPMSAGLWELGGAKRFDCKWVTVEALLTWAEYWHYRANAHNDFNEWLTDWDNHRFLIEAFEDESVSMQKLHRATVQMTGVYAELCDEETLAPFKDAWIYGGPCHYGPAGIFQRVRIDKILEPPFRRLTGEANRKVLAQLGRASKDWPEAPLVRAAVVDWIAAARAGPDAFREFMFGPSDRLDEDAREYAQDPNAWHNFLSSSDSPFLKLRKAQRNWQVEYFYSLDVWPQEFSTVENVTACVCLKSDCEERWPLLPGDTDYMWDDYICAEVEKEKDGWWIGRPPATP